MCRSLVLENCRTRWFDLCAPNRQLGQDHWQRPLRRLWKPTDASRPPKTMVVLVYWRQALLDLLKKVLIKIRSVLIKIDKTTCYDIIPFLLQHSELLDFWADDGDVDSPNLGKRSRSQMTSTCNGDVRQIIIVFSHQQSAQKPKNSVFSNTVWDLNIRRPWYLSHPIF